MFVFEVYFNISATYGKNIYRLYCYPFSKAGAKVVYFF